MRASAIASEARHLLAMLESVADAEAAASGRLRSQPRPLDLAALVREVTATPVAGRSITLAGADEPLWMQADPGRIRQVLTNLLGNAAQYSPPDTPIDVIVRADPRRKTAVVEVHDRGRGIPAAERRRLFRKFTRLTTADGTRGSGLGLYICKAIVEDHGGRIAYRDRAFSFTLPLAAGVPRRTAAPRAPARVGDHPTVGHPRSTKTVKQGREARREGGGTTRVERVSVRPEGAAPRRTAKR